MTTSIPYASSHRAAIANLDPCFGPDAALLPDSEPLPDALQQNPHILHVMQILADLFTDRVDTFADTNTIVYYDPADGNRRFQPDVYVAFGVDAAAIRQRNGYLIWEVGKPPDFVLEVASESTAPLDIGGKRDLYAGLGIPEYWRFDASGGTMYGAPVGRRVSAERRLSAISHRNCGGRCNLGIQPTAEIESALERRMAGVTGL